MMKAGTALGTGSRVEANDGKQLKLGQLVKSGGAGSIYLLPEQPEWVAKIYHADVDLALYERKVQAMLQLAPDLPDLTSGDMHVTQIAWPQALLRDSGKRFRGFSMPRLHLDETIELEYMLQERQARAAGLPVGLGARITLAANASALVAELHRHHHYVVDLKPVNIRLYRKSLHLAMLDCDGFSIHGEKERFPAPQYTPDYLAPEFHRRGLSAGAEEEQDRFALAVIVFQLLNFGIHPFSGRPLGNNVPTDIPARIAGRYYAYGLRAHPSIRPNPASGHEQLPAELRHFLDRAFAGNGRPRPTASEWAKVLAPYALKSSGRLVVCSRNQEHQYFADKKCAACARAALMARAASAPKAAPGAGRAPPHAKRRTASPPQAPAMPSSAPKFRWWEWVLIILVGVVGGVIRLTVFLWRSLNNWLTKHAPRWRLAVDSVVIVSLGYLLFSWLFLDHDDARPASRARAERVLPAPSAEPSLPPTITERAAADVSVVARSTIALRKPIAPEDIDALLETVHKGDGAGFRTQFAEFVKRPRPRGRDDLPKVWDALKEYRAALHRQRQTGKEEDVDQYLEKALKAAPHNSSVLAEVAIFRLIHFSGFGKRPYEQVRSGLEATRSTYYSAIAVDPKDVSHWHGLGMTCVAIRDGAQCAESAFAIASYLKQESQATQARRQDDAKGIDDRGFGYSRLKFMEEVLFRGMRKVRLNTFKEHGAALAEKLKETPVPPPSQTRRNQPLRE